MSLIIFILAGFLLFFMFQLLGRARQTFAQKKLWHRSAGSLLPLAELILWVAYAFWGIHLLFGNHIYFDLVVGIMVVLVIVAIAWFVFRDLFAGVLLKAEKALEPGQTIKTPFAEGKIKHLGSRSIELINDSGELVKIPYSRLSNELFILPPDNEDSLPHHLEIILQNNQNPDELRKRIRENLIAMPWVLLPVPDITVIKGKDGVLKLHVMFYTHIRSHAAIVEEKLKIIAGQY
ncbi:MAG: hypothetical protein EA394_05395 [Bacteroidia bacterium]|nr:MAG: hypothetical protein EA394_05395 [Bacteroidia bacterium]